MWKKLRSTHSQLLGLIVVIEMALVATLLLSVFHLVRTQIDRDDAERAVELRDDLLLVARQQGQGALTQLIRSRAALGEDELLLLTDPRGVRIAGNLAEWPSSVRPGERWHIITARIGGRSAYRPYGVIGTRLPGGDRLLAGHLLESSAQTKHILSSASFYALLLAVPLAFGGAWAAVRLIDRRIGRIIEVARSVTAGDLEGRVPMDGSGDRFDQLARTMNLMLDRLGRLVAELRLVTDSLAHDLRSPLTRLRARIDRGVAARDEDGLREEMQAIGDEADSLLGMLSTSLEISRAEAGIGRDHMERCDLGALLRDLADLYGPLVEEAQRTIIVDAPVPAFAAVHRDLLSRALSNLIDNALKYGKGRIRLACRRDGDSLSLAVEDEGTGIAECDRDRALRRFGRLDPARGHGGAGLGLSLVTAAANLHDGVIEMAVTEGVGFEVRIVLN